MVPCQSGHMRYAVRYFVVTMSYLLGNDSEVRTTRAARARRETADCMRGPSVADGPSSTDIAQSTTSTTGRYLELTR